MSGFADDSLLDLGACNDVVIALNNIKHRWETLGTFLKISNPSLMSIANSYGDDHFRKLSALISCWLRREKHNDHPSWKNLCIALENMGEGLLAEKIARAHKTTLRSGVGPSSSINIDELSSNLSPNVSASDLLREYSASIISRIADPIKVGNDLTACGLISPHEIDGLIGMQGVTPYEKATRLVNSLSRSLRAKNDAVKLLQICKVLEQQDTDALNDLVKEILGKIIIAPATTANTATTTQPPAKDSQPKGEFEVDVEKIKNIFIEKGEKLKAVISSDILLRAAEKLAEESIIAKDDKKPSFDSIVKQFIDGLDFLDDHDEVEKQCQSFLSILYESGQGVGGPFNKCIDWLQKRFNQLGYSIKVI